MTFQNSFLSKKKKEKDHSFLFFPNESLKCRLVFCLGSSTFKKKFYTSKNIYASQKYYGDQTPPTTLVPPLYIGYN